MRSTFLVILSYSAIYLVWSSTYLAIKWAVTTIPPFYVVGIRFFIAGIGLLGVAALQRRLTALSPRTIWNTIVIGALLLAGGNGLVTLAQKRVDSYIAALIISSTPILVAAWDRIILQRRLAVSSIIGIVAGLAGVAILLASKMSTTPELSGYALVLLAAVALWGLGTSLSKRLTLPSDPLIVSGLQQSVIGGVCIAVMAGSEPEFFFRLADVSLVSWLSVGYLTLFGGVTLVGYSYLLKHEPNERVVSYSFVNPFLATILGTTVAGEALVPHLFPAALCIFAGLFLVFFGKRVLNF